jgi:hypothetical protein
MEFTTITEPCLLPLLYTKAGLETSNDVNDLVNESRIERLARRGRALPHRLANDTVTGELEVV